MKRKNYCVVIVRNVFKRIGFIEWQATPSVVVLNHPSFHQEVILDIDEDTIVWSRLKLDLDDMNLRAEFFDHLYDNETLWDAQIRSFST